MNMHPPEVHDKRISYGFKYINHGPIISSVWFDLNQIQKIYLEVFKWIARLK